MEMSEEDKKVPDEKVPPINDIGVILVRKADDTGTQNLKNSSKD